MKKVSRKKVLISEQDWGEIGDRIAWLRKERGQTLSGLAAVILVSKGNLSDIEKNRYKPSYQTIVKITEQFGVNTGWLINGEGSPFESRLDYCDICNFAGKGSVRDIIDLSLKIGELDKSLLEEIVNFLREKFLAAIHVHDRRNIERRKVLKDKAAPGGAERREVPDRRQDLSEDN